MNDRHVFSLPHGLQLVVWNKSGRLSLTQIAEFLANAMHHFKNEMNVRGADATDGNRYAEMEMEDGSAGANALGQLEVSCATSEKPTLKMWVNAVVYAYTVANSVEEMQESLPEYQRVSEEEDCKLKEVLDLLAKPGGEYLALAAMFALSPADKVS